MDSLITAAARALAVGDPLAALKRVALRDDAPALALRGIAMAQLGDLVRAKALLRSAARAFGRKQPVAYARCVVAEAEIALVSRDLGWPAQGAGGGADDARRARRPHKRRPCPLSRDPAPSPVRAHRRGGAYARRARPFSLPCRVENRARAGGCRDRDAAPPDEGGARCARSGGARSPPGTHSCAHCGGRKRTSRLEHARCASDCA